MTTKLTLKSESCPYCGVSLIAGDIPQESRHLYLPLGAEDDGHPLHYYRTVGLYAFDYTVALQCPDCQAIDPLTGREDLFMKSDWYQPENAKAA